MDDAALDHDAGHVDPGVVAAEAGGPDHGGGADRAAGGEADAVRRRGTTRGRTSTPARRRRRSGVPITRSPRSRIRRARRESAVFVITPSRVSHQNRSRPSSRCGSSRASLPVASVTSSRGGQLEGDLATRSCRRRPRRRGPRARRRVAVRRAVQLDDVRAEGGGDPRDHRHLERPRGHDHLPRRQPAVRGVHHVGAVDPLEALDRVVEQDRQREPRGVRREVVGDLVLGRVGVGRGRERPAREAVVLRGGEQPQRVPAPAPGWRRPRGRPRGPRSAAPRDAGGRRWRGRPGRRRRRSRRAARGWWRRGAWGLLGGVGTGGAGSMTTLPTTSAGSRRWKSPGFRTRRSDPATRCTTRRFPRRDPGAPRRTLLAPVRHRAPPPSPGGAMHTTTESAAHRRTPAPATPMATAAATRRRRPRSTPRRPAVPGRCSA